MEVGTGIFLGALILGMILLYISTRDRWNWRKLIGRSLMVSVVFGAVIGLGSWAHYAYANRIVPVETFMDLTVKDTQDDIKFKKGKPEPGSTDGVWAYADKDGNWDYIVRFQKQKVRAVIYVGTCTYCNNLYGLGIGTPYNVIVEKLGEPSSVLSSKDGLDRYVSFDKTNLVFRLAQGKVVGFGMYDATMGPLKFDSTQTVSGALPAKQD